ncbi:MAG: carbohydrate binding domain-containing protein [Candidatus Poribacteria bacterium]
MADDATAHNSKKSAKIIQTKPSANASNVYAYYRDIIIEKSKVYTIAFWAKLDQNEGNEKEIDISIQTLSGIPQRVYLRTIMLNNTDWKEYIYTFISPKDIQGNSWIGLLVGLSDVDFWFDDIRFFEGEPPDEITGEKTGICLSSKFVSTWASIKKINK